MAAMESVQKPKISFVIKMAIIMSLLALSIDAMLPALSQMGSGLGVVDIKKMQSVISTVFIGMGFGLLFFGPLSDAFGRKKPLYLGLSIFLVGSLVSYFSQSLTIMLVGRLLQGFGASACRVLSTAMIRDQYSGPAMGKVMSLIMVVFIIVPALAPTVGQAVLYFATWDKIFLLLFLIGLLCVGILFFFQEETLPADKRREVTVHNIKNGIIEIFKNPISRIYTFVSGILFGAFVGYLSTSQLIFQEHFQLGDKFSYYFGCLALFLGMSSFMNSKLVEKFSMHNLVKTSFLALFSFASIYLVYLFFHDGDSPLILFMIYMAFSFLFVGILFGNLNALAMEPLGHIAGLGNSVISSIQTFIGAFIGGTIASFYSNNLYPLPVGFFLASIVSLTFLSSKKLRTSPKLTL